MSDVIEVCVPEGVVNGDLSEAVISAWLYDDGAVVSKGAVIGQIMVEKVEFEIASPGDGILEIVREPEDGTVKTGDLIARIVKS